MKPRLLTGILLVCMAIPAAAQVPADDAGSAVEFNHANALYREGDFTGALAAYEALISDGIQHPDLYYNASNAAYRTGSLGKAILYLERALRLAPSDDDIRENLAFLNSLRQDGDAQDDNPLFAMIGEWYGRRPAGSFAIGSGLSFAAALLLATAALFTARWKRYALWTATALFLSVFLFSSGLFALKLHHELTVTEAVVLAPEVSVHSGPGPENTTVFSLREGTKVAIERRQDSWDLIRLDSGAAGWIPADATGRI